MTLIATPSNHEHIIDAFAAQGFVVRHSDEHVRDHLEQLDPLVSGAPVLANRDTGGRLSQELDALRKRLVARSRRSHETVEVHPGHRVTVTHSDGRRDDVDLFDELAGRFPELRRMVGTTRNLVGAPDYHTVLERDMLVTGVDTAEQALPLPADVKVIAIAGQVPPWAVDPGVDLVELDANLSSEAQAAAAIEAVRAPVPA